MKIADASTPRAPGLPPDRHVDEAWWQGAVVYQIYPRSFMDANGDGIGDLAGIVSKLEYVCSLGVDAIWIGPFYSSPMRDFGYDISDFRSVDEIFGNLEDFKALLEKAHRLGLRVILDQVLGHTSDQHPWFRESRTSRDNAKARWYVWADPKPDGSPPNNWLSPFGGSAWTWEPRRAQYYFHNFLACQPDLNFHNQAVREAQLENLRFWLELGVDGVRLDAANFYFHSEDLCDNPPVHGRQALRAGLGRDNPYGYQQHIYDNTRPETLDFLKALRGTLDEYHQRASIGEVFADDAIGVMGQYASGNQMLHMAYTFELLGESSSPEFIRSVIAEYEQRIGNGWPCWALSNHDVERCASRWGQDADDPAHHACVAMAMLLSLRGGVTLFQGEELALPQAEVPYGRIQDPYGVSFWPVFKGRDGCRTPMVWDEAKWCGFSVAEPWLPIDDRHRAMSVVRQEGQPHSMLNWTRRFLAWRKTQPALVRGDMTLLSDTGRLLCWIRRYSGQSLLAAFNLTGRAESTRLPRPVRETLHGHGFNGVIQASRIVLPPYEALFAIVEEERDT